MKTETKNKNIAFKIRSEAFFSSRSKKLEDIKRLSLVKAKQIKANFGVIKILKQIK